VAEVAHRDASDRRGDPASWSRIDDWEAATLMHLPCVKSALGSGLRVPYGGAVSQLLLDEIEERPVFAVIDGGACPAPATCR
jgi:hypothetical protein